jgi:hypothetical protein
MKPVARGKNYAGSFWDTCIQCETISSTFWKGLKLNSVVLDRFMYFEI